jgi:hypothetical protein
MNNQQLELVETELGEIVNEMELRSNTAYYRITVVKLNNMAGFLVRKQSGAFNRRPHIETYFRSDSISAINKYDQLIRAKTSKAKSRERHYSPVLI